jgi:hypothetical protein
MALLLKSDKHAPTECVLDHAMHCRLFAAPAAGLHGTCSSLFLLGGTAGHAWCRWWAAWCMLMSLPLLSLGFMLGSRSRAERPGPC